MTTKPAYTLTNSTILAILDDLSYSARVHLLKHGSNVRVVELHLKSARTKETHTLTLYLQ